MGKCALIGAECPRTNDPNAKRYCPAWSDGIVWTNQQTGEEKIVNCSFEMLPHMVIEVIKASNRPAAAVESMRNDLADRLAGMTSAIQALPGPRHGEG